MDPFDMASFRHFYAEQLRHQEGAEPAADEHTRQRTPARLNEAAGPLQGLVDLRANRPGIDPGPGESRRAPRSSLGGATPVAGASRRMPATGLVREQVIDSRLRIDHARGPQQARTSDAAMLQHMIGLLERLERGNESLASLLEDLPVDVSFHFRVTSRHGPRGLNDEGRELLRRQPGGDALVQRFDQAVAAAPAGLPRRRDSSLNNPASQQMRDHMFEVLKGLRNGRSLAEMLLTMPPQVSLNFGRYDLSPAGRALVSRYRNGILQEFERALEQPSARRRLPVNSGTAAPEERRMPPPPVPAPRDRPGPSRRTVETVLMDEGLEKASAQLLDPCSGMADIAHAAGVSEEQLRDFFTEDGPTPRGWQLLSRCNLTTQATVMQNVVQAQQRRAAFRAEQVQPEAMEPAAAARSEPSSPDTPTAGTLIGGGLLNASHAFLDPYASMADIANAAGVSEEALRRYFTEDGLTDEGVALLSDCAESVQAAIAGNVSKGNENRAAFWRDRQILLSGGMMRASTAFLRPDTSMADIANAAGVSEAELRRYFTEHGLTKQGKSLLSECTESIRSAVENNVMYGSGNRVIWRQKQTRNTSQILVNGGLMRASAEFLRPGASMVDVARAAGVSEEQLRDFFTEDGPTKMGWKLASRCSESAQVSIMHNVGMGIERRSALRREQAEQEARVPQAQIPAAPSSSIVVPDSDWTGWGFNQSPPHDDVTGPARFAQPEMPDPMYQGFPSSGWPHAGGPQQPPATTFSQGMGPAGQILPDPSSSFVVPDSNWTGWGFNQSPPHDEVTGPARPPQREASDSARWQEPAASSGSLYGDAQGFHGASTSYAGPSGHAAYSQPAWAGAVPAQPAPETIDVESYQPRRPEQRHVGVAERLRNPRAWLRDDDIMTYVGLMIHRLGESLAESLGENGQALINQRLNIVDSQDVHTLRTGDAASRASVLRRLTGPILLLPVHRATEGNHNDHWSLLVVNRASPTPRAYHFDSMVPREYVQVAGSLEAFQDQFQVAREVANALGVPELIGRPMAEQEDGHSCGDHVIAGIEELAHRIVHHREGERMSWSLSRIQPNRQHIVDTLVHHEQFLAQANASGAPSQRLHTDAGPSRRRR